MYATSVKDELLLSFKAASENLDRILNRYFQNIELTFQRI